MMKTTRTPMGPPRRSSQVNASFCPLFGQLISNSSGTPIFQRSGCEHTISEQKGAALLLSIANIVEKEIDEGFDLEDDLSTQVPLHEPFVLPRSSNNNNALAGEEQQDCLSPFTLTSSSSSSSQDDGHWQRIRSVSIDEHQHHCLPSPGRTRQMRSSRQAQPGLVSPTSSPVIRGRALRKPTHKKKAAFTKATATTPPASPRASTRPLQPKHVLKGQIVKTILRKKFSWKNFPELEAFLIANREEYLRHSALNYTVQQKQYNNKLTERLLELAAEHGYVFDEGSFSFVTVRDRIRCYFKSYVQSAKKRGVIIGYAARKAGLLTEGDLEGVSGHIVVPSK